MAAYQHAMMTMGKEESESVTRTMSLNAKAASPMALEGYLKANHEWKCQGDDFDLVHVL